MYAHIIKTIESIVPRFMCKFNAELIQKSTSFSHGQNDLMKI